MFQEKLYLIDFPRNLSTYKCLQHCEFGLHAFSRICKELCTYSFSLNLKLTTNYTY